MTQFVKLHIVGIIPLCLPVGKANVGKQIPKTDYANFVYFIFDVYF